MENYICVTCGTQFAESEEQAEKCPICEDERQYVPPEGQQWTTLDKLKSNHRNSFEKKEPALYGVASSPRIAIGQRALLIQTTEGNILWDCLSLIDEATVDLINGIGGLQAIAISHPHYYSSMVEWSKAFGDIPIYLHESDRQWVMRPDQRIRFWSGDNHSLMDAVTLIRTGGHFEGGTVLHWPSGANGRGALLTGDILQVVPDLQHVSFMYSYPNQIPVNAATVEQIQKRLEGFTFNRIYGAFRNRNILKNAQKAVDHSAERYIRAIS